MIIIITKLRDAKGECHMEEFIEGAIERANLLSDYAEIFPGWNQVQSKFLNAIAEYQSGKVDHSRAITEFYNEVVIASDICMECRRYGWSLEYEPLCPNGRSVDFCIIKNNLSRIYVDVKTIHPKNNDALKLYRKCLDEGLLANNVGVHFQRLNIEDVDAEPTLDGVTFHHVTAARGKFLDYSIELEQKNSFNKY
jgi:hypothetical protein